MRVKVASQFIDVYHMLEVALQTLLRNLTWYRSFMRFRCNLTGLMHHREILASIKQNETDARPQRHGTPPNSSHYPQTGETSGPSRNAVNIKPA